MKTLFLLPGLMCDKTVWVHQIAALEAYAEIKVPDFRGFDSLQAMAQSVLDQAPERFSVVGHSMGGRVALELMHMAGDRIDRFAIMDTGDHGVPAGEIEKRQVLLDLATSDGLQAVADAWILPMLHPDRHNDQNLITDITSMILRNSVEDFYGQVKALLGRNDRSASLAQIKQHVLLVCGDEDGWSPVAQHEAMQSRLKNSELKVIQNSGHMVTMEKPEELSQILLKWFTSD